jgi:hypothetical protein
MSKIRKKPEICIVLVCDWICRDLNSSVVLSTILSSHSESFAGMRVLNDWPGLYISYERHTQAYLA